MRTNHLLGRRLAEIRKAQKFTQEQLASRLGAIGKRQLQNYENGTSVIPAERLLEAAQILECDPAELLKPPGSPIAFRERRIRC